MSIKIRYPSSFECHLIKQHPSIVVRFNSLGPSDAIWRWRSWSTLVRVMACCLTTPSHYLNQCCLIISKVLWHSSEDIIIRSQWVNGAVHRGHGPYNQLLSSGTCLQKATGWQEAQRRQNQWTVSVKWTVFHSLHRKNRVNSLRPSDEYMRQ